MSSKVGKRLVPKLRFPEFHGENGWPKTLLGDVCVVLQGYGFPEKLQGKLHGLYPFCKVSDISRAVSDAGGALGAAANYVDEEDLLELRAKLIPVGTTVFAKIGEALRLNRRAITAVPCLIDNNVTGIKTKADKAVDGFVYFLMQGIDLNEYCGGVVPSINKTTLESISITAPGFQEQRRIADCLTSIDDIIAAQAKKIEALKAHKKGLMQQLFPAEGETVPRLRFPKFRDGPGWQIQKISNVLKKVSNPVDVGLNEMYRQIGIRSHGKGIFHKELVSGKQLGNKRVFWVEDNAFVVNIVFAWEQAVATTSKAEKGMIASHRFPMYRARSKKANVDCIAHFFLTKKGKSLLALASPGGAGRNRTLGQKDFENLEFLLPEVVEEQIEIADSLSSVNELIAAQTQKLDMLKAHKKGLMQGLFPASREGEV